MDRGGVLVVSVFALNSGDTSSNLSMLARKFESTNKEKRLGLVQNIFYSGCDII